MVTAPVTANAALAQQLRWITHNRRLRLRVRAAQLVDAVAPLDLRTMDSAGHIAIVAGVKRLHIAPMYIAGPGYSGLLNDWLAGDEVIHDELVRRSYAIEALRMLYRVYDVPYEPGANWTEADWSAAPKRTYEDEEGVQAAKRPGTPRPAYLRLVEP